MKGLAVFASLCLAVVLAQHGPDGCSTNEELDPCGNSCEPSCRDPNPQICPLDCFAGCRCRRGFFRNDQNRCVSHCPPPPTTTQAPMPPIPASCSEVRCPPGTHCEMVTEPCTRQPCAAPSPKCVNDRPSTTPRPPPVHPTAPPPRPPPRPPASCSEVRCPSGTHCEMVVEPCTRQPCAAPSPKCVNDRLPTPPQPPKPPASCSNVRCPPGTHCEMIAQQCSRQPCPAPTPRCVNNGNRPPSPTPSCSNTQCPPGFRCQMVNSPCQRHPCPPPKPQCFRVTPPQMRCPRNESWRNCSSKCEPSCRDQNPRCDKSCGRPKCQCDTGFLRDRSGDCVRRQHCHRK